MYPPGPKQRQNQTTTIRLDGDGTESSDRFQLSSARPSQPEQGWVPGRGVGPEEQVTACSRRPRFLPSSPPILATLYCRLQSCPGKKTAGIQGHWREGSLCGPPRGAIPPTQPESGVNPPESLHKPSTSKQRQGFNTLVKSTIV